ncbi:MAG: hypothetical protein ACRDZ3_16495 [Acidimicrobiia bacterium]
MPTLLRCLAAEAVDVLVPLFDAVRAWAPFGLRGMWGALADGIGGRAAFGAAERGEDGAPAFRRAMAVVDAIAKAAPLSAIIRPFLVPVEWSGGVTHLPRKGTCCLLYKTTADRDPSGENYCTACPLRDEESQLVRWVRWLEDRAADRETRSQTG